MAVELNKEHSLASLQFERNVPEIKQEYHDMDTLSNNADYKRLTQDNFSNVPSVHLEQFRLKAVSKILESTGRSVKFSGDFEEGFNQMLMHIDGVSVMQGEISLDPLRNSILDQQHLFKVAAEAGMLPILIRFSDMPITGMAVSKEELIAEIFKAASSAIEDRYKGVGDRNLGFNTEIPEARQEWIRQEVKRINDSVTSILEKLKEEDWL